jgi:hypothetical protein
MKDNFLLSAYFVIFVQKVIISEISHNLQTTMLYTHVALKNIMSVKSPLDY